MSIEIKRRDDGTVKTYRDTNRGVEVATSKDMKNVRIDIVKNKVLREVRGYTAGKLRARIVFSHSRNKIYASHRVKKRKLPKYLSDVVYPDGYKSREVVGNGD